MTDWLRVSQPARIHIAPGWLAAAALLVLTAILWLPVGLDGGVTGDGWIYFMQADEGNAMSQATPLRLFLPIPWILAYSLAPGTFVGLNLFLLLLILGKGLMLYLVVRWVVQHDALAFGAAALAVVYPVDQGIFYLGALAIHFALFCFLLSVYLWIRWWESRRLSMLLAMLLAQLMTVGIYELTYPLVLLTPLLLLYRHRVIDRRLLGAVALWFLVPGLQIVWYIGIALSFPRALAYQSGVANIDRSIGAMLGSLATIYRRHFWDGWLPSFAAVQVADSVLAAAAAVLTGGVSLRLLRTSSGHPPLPLLLVVGLALIAVGVALYLPTQVREELFRTYYFSSLGAALVVACLALWLGRRSLVFPVLVGLLVGWACLLLLAQHRLYYAHSDTQQVWLSRLAEVIPRVESGSGVVVIDESNEQDFARVVGSGFYLEYMLPALYPDYSLEARLCLPEMIGAEEDAECRFFDDGFVAPTVRNRFMYRYYDALVVVRYTDAGFAVVDDLSPYGATSEAYQPRARVDADAPLPQRVQTLFAP